MSMLRLSKIADYLTTERNLESAIRFIAMNVCPSGELCRVYLARIENDMSLKHVASFGFSSDFVQKHDQYNLMHAGNLLESIEAGILILPTSDSRLKGQDDFVESPKDVDLWKSIVYLPMLPDFAVALTSTIRISDDEEHRKYFNTLKSLLNLYLHLISESGFSAVQRLNKGKTPVLGEKLTERQSLILDLIREGKTNIAIADRLGYSESLIRQETMVIYQKLGVDGRREITKN